mmetsp:Transcript_3292/g.5772  ORF Transcript_3292/g.5772 Transcript_3292/m.5772 type:complete len:159 (-) Transcript_3292:786-1262(-)
MDQGCRSGENLVEVGAVCGCGCGSVIEESYFSVDLSDLKGFDANKMNGNKSSSEKRMQNSLESGINENGDESKESGSLPRKRRMEATTENSLRWELGANLDWFRISNGAHVYEVKTELQSILGSQLFFERDDGAHTADNPAPDCKLLVSVSKHLRVVS